MRVRTWRTLFAAVLLFGAGCANLCPCCDGFSRRADRPPLNEGPPPPQLPPDAVPPVGPRPGGGAYGGTGP